MNTSAYRKQRLSVLFALFLFGSSAAAQDNTGNTTFVLWNGFLRMTNVLELVNVGGDDLSVTVTLYDIQGNQVSETEVTVPAESQKDLILNDMAGFSADSYGIARLSYAGSNLEGRLSFYRLADDGVNYDFAFAVPFSDTLTGTSAVSFNTFQPSLNPAQVNDRVAQWLSIVNLDSSSAKEFTVNRYDQQGSLLTSIPVAVGPLGRIDIEGGHEDPGPAAVGLNVIVPADQSSAYLAHLMRYGEKATIAGNQASATNYAFAFPLLAVSGDAETQWVPISSGAGADNWLELINAGADQATVAVTLYDNQGTEVQEDSVTLGAYAQQHIHASSLLGSGMTGAASIRPASSGLRIIAQSMFYFRDAAGSIEAMYGSQSRQVQNGGQYGSYNLFLGMFNWLRIFNTSSSSQQVGVTVGSSVGQSSVRTITLEPYSGIDLGLHETATYGTAPDTFGVVSLDRPVLAEVLRIRPTAAGGVDFAFPTPVRRYGSVITEDAFYVSAATGDDSGPGTQSRPWRTIQHAADTLTAGQTVYIMAGTYQEQVIPRNSGTADNYIVYAAYPGATVTIDGSAISLPEEDIGLFNLSNKSYIRISGLRITNVGPNDNNAGILVSDSSNILIENNYTYNTTSSGIGVWRGSDVTIDGNEVELACNDGEQECITVAGTDGFIIRNNNIHNNGPGTIGGEGIDAKDGASNGEIYNNRVHDMNDRLGIYVEAWDKHTYNIKVYNNIVYNVSGADGFTLGSEQGGLLENIEVYNNIAYNNGCNGITVSVGDEGSGVPRHPLKDIFVINNTLYNNGSDDCYGAAWGGGISVDNPDIDDVIIRNNICSQNRFYQIEVEEGVPSAELTIDFNLIDGFRDEMDEETRGTNYQEGSAGFVDAAGGDFRIRGSSIAVDNGSSSLAPAADYDGNSRPQGAGVDIGAFEFGGS